LVHSALDSGGRGTHIPFRASKLTQVLKDSFVNAKARCVLSATDSFQVHLTPFGLLRSGR
jgi:hypothetical protein